MLSVKKVLDHGKELLWTMRNPLMYWVKMLYILKDLGIDCRDRKLMCELYMENQVHAQLVEEFDKVVCCPFCYFQSKQRG